MLSRHAPSPKTVSSVTTRVLPAASCARVAPFPSSQQTRGLATVQDAPPPPKRTYGGLRDQDRIFQNLYGHHGADLASAKKYGDWYKTKEILLKGHDWVCCQLPVVFLGTDSGVDYFRNQGVWASRTWGCWISFRNEMGELDGSGLSDLC
jgi:hypothetical protein